jgi:hypothetical protein
MRLSLSSLACAAALFSVSASPLDLSTVVSSTHWAPCYFITPLPSLLDGAATLAGTGTRAIKLAFSDPASNYPWGPAWNLSGVVDLASLAAHPWYNAVFNNTLPAPYTSSYQVFSLITYIVGTEPQWCKGEITPADEAEITRQFSGVTAFLLSAYAGSGKRFIFEHWEGDWAARCATYDPNEPPTPAAIAAMTRWLAARQAGVDQGRQAYCEEEKALSSPLGGVDCRDGRAYCEEEESSFGGVDCRDGRAYCEEEEALSSSFGGVDCRDGRAVHAAAGVEVFHAAEVNLVASSIEKGIRTNIVTSVVPFVSLDMISYSSYDTMRQSPLFGQALDFIAANHNRTNASPSPAVYVAEFGIAESREPHQNLVSTVENVVAWSLSVNPSTGVRRAAHVFYWELFDNEVASTPSQRCDATSGPIRNMTDLAGFWLVRPDGTEAWTYGYMSGLINGSIPVPVPSNDTWGAGV